VIEGSAEKGLKVTRVRSDCAPLRRLSVAEAATCVVWYQAMANVGEEDLMNRGRVEVHPQKSQRTMVPLGRTRVFYASILLLCLLSVLGRASSQTVEGKQIHNADSSEANECAECHEEAVRGFARSRMAQSMRLPGRGPEGTVRVPGTTIHMYSNQKGTWQTLETQGHTETYRVSYVIGSGTHASGYLISLANHLFQSPVAYYKRRSAYGLAPGYENKPAPDFTRPVEPGCLFCHAGSFKAVSGTQNEYAAKPFEHLAIECSRCHGPVDAHLDDPSSSNIVNPARLEPAARDSICEQCHLKGVARVLNPGKEFTDFVAGQPLENTFTIYRYAMPEGEEPPFKVISQSEQLALSRCKLASGNALWCGTCHDPHHEPADAVPYYRAKCLSCHARTHFAAIHPPKSSNCIGCHMPKRQTYDGGHTVFTDHRIQRISDDKRAGEPIGILPWRDPPAEFAKRNLGIGLIDAGIEGKTWTQIVSGYRVLTEVQGQFQQDQAMYQSIGSALLIGGQDSEAAKAFELAVRFAPDSSPDEADLGSAYAALGSSQLAEAHLERALEIDPLNLNAAELLIDLYVKDGQSSRAEVVRRRFTSLIH
jgi:hypothetical protein